ncbi:tetratricopeptide repeat protein [Plesiomonas shigelloides]|uniref:tetratricopeptide repeat protein n=1 Tax=Plesiomonas shigelloides TaxID=703 RepID=UPI001C498F2F|nr:tetratricopeptide repeat protein [Plesiomonas shigelloides]
MSSLNEQQLVQKAQQGQGRAQFELANRLAGKAQPDYRAAMHWMKKAAENGVMSVDKATQSYAAAQVAMWYEQGLGEPKDLVKARSWWQQSARLGNAQASWRLALLCQQKNDGLLVAACIDSVEQAAKGNVIEAQRALAQWYSQKSEASKEAITWLTKAAQAGDNRAQATLASFYAQGRGVPRNLAIAERWYIKAAKQGDAQALLWMAEQSRGKTALGWYQQAAEAGSATAQLWLAHAYQSGKSLPANRELAHKWLVKAVNSGSHEAEYLFALQQTSSAQREHYLMLAAEGGLTKAQVALGRASLRSQDFSQARAWFAKAATQGDVDGCFEYGEMLRTGQGGEHDYHGAYQQYRYAAQRGNRMAQYRMGMMREKGLGAPRNNQHAYAWFSLAATGGMAEAIQARETLEEMMTPEEVKRAQNLSEYWFTQQNLRQ